MSGVKDPMGSIAEEIDLLERHISILKTVKVNQPVGLIRLSEMTGIPKHKVRYSLKLLEQQGIIIATPEGAKVSDSYDKFMNEMTAGIRNIATRVEELKKLI